MEKETNLNLNEEINQLKNGLTKAQTELSLLYEISNAMRTTLKLDEILYVILTAVTAHVGLGFNRAMLFLVNEKEGFIEGKMGIGPDTGEQANVIWKNIDTERVDLLDLIKGYKNSNNMFSSRLNILVRNLKLPLKEESGLLALTLLEGMPLHINKDKLTSVKNDILLNVLQTEDFVIVPLKAHDKVIGLILADNLYTHKPITKDDIRILGMFANQAGLAIENSRLYEQTLIQSHQDSLTKLWNHAYFQFILKNELESAKMETKSLTLILIDIDNFKNYNDNLGHQAGDLILCGIANLIKQFARRQDYVCRYGGEEFAVLLPNCSKKEALNIAERIRQQVENYHFENENIQPSRKITISLGVATYPEDANNSSSLIDSSDKRMYQAKKEGKNKVVSA
jgi:diguanylate cyclase (GGDEF)-like protein